MGRTGILITNWSNYEQKYQPRIEVRKWDLFWST